MFFFIKFWPYVRLVFKSSFKSNQPLYSIYGTILVKCEDVRAVEIKSYMHCMKIRHGKFVLHKGNLFRGIDKKDGDFKSWIFLKNLKGILDSIPSPSPKIQIMGGKVCLRCKGKTLLDVVNNLLKTKSLLTSPSSVLPYYLK